VLTSIYLEPDKEEITNLRLLERWLEIQEKEVSYKEYYLDQAEIVVIGFGTAGRIALSAVRAARAQGLSVGLLRPITVSPFPSAQIAELAQHVRAFLVVELNTGQMLDDVRLAVAQKAPVDFYGRLGGVVPFPEEILHEIHRVWKQPPDLHADTRRNWHRRMQAELLESGG
jgi:2-oxoglutarate ferredoxin oxidoreductase subunit alpha